MAGTLVDTNILQVGVAMGMKALRENCVLSRLVNRDYEQEVRGAKVGEVVKVSIPAAVTTRAITSDVVPPAVTAVTPTSVSITLDQWKEAPFAMEDKAIAQLQRGIIPDQLTEAAKSIANTIDQYLHGRINATGGVYNYTGTAGTTPFANDLSDFNNARKLMNDTLAPPDDRFVILDTAAETNALGLRAVQDASMRGGAGSLSKGEIGMLGGARWFMSQNVQSHTTTGAATITVNDAGVEVGDTTMIWDGGGTAMAVGDVFTVAGDTQTYVVESSTATVVTIYPAAKVAWADSAVVTIKASHGNNLLIHRDCVAFAMAPLMDTAMTRTRRENTAVIVDEESGLSLRLEISDQYKQTQWAFDALYGGAVVRKEFATRIAG